MTRGETGSDTVRIMVIPYPYPYFFSDSESERIVCGYEYGVVAFRLRIRTEYGANTVRLRKNILSDLSLKIKIGLTSGVKLACKFFLHT